MTLFSRACIGDRVMCVADYRGMPRILYEVIPIRNDWFKEVTLSEEEGRKILRDVVTSP